MSKKRNRKLPPPPPGPERFEIVDAGPPHYPGPPPKIRTVLGWGSDGTLVVVKRFAEDGTEIPVIPPPKPSEDKSPNPQTD
jgi:hypothetical protein